MNCCNNTPNFARAARAGYNPCCMVDAMPGIFRSFSNQLSGIPVQYRNNLNVYGQIKGFGR